MSPFLVWIGNAMTRAIHGLKVAAKTLKSFDEPDADLSHQCAEMVRTVIDSHDSRRLGNYCMEMYGKHLVNPSGIFWWKN